MDEGKDPRNAVADNEEPDTEPDPLAVYNQQAALESGNAENTLDADISAKAKNYVARKKEAIDAEVQAIFADRVNTYKAIKCHKNRCQLACTLFPGEPAATALEIGSFFGGGDGRMAACSLQLDFTRKAAASYSFFTETLMCDSCPLYQHHAILTRGEPDKEATRRIFLLCDQSGPPCIPSTADKSPCVAVLRIEGGLLKDLAEEFLRTSSGCHITAGSICAIYSACQLALSGLEDYVRDLVTVNGWFNRVRSSWSAAPTADSCSATPGALQHGAEPPAAKRPP